MKYIPIIILLACYSFCFSQTNDKVSSNPLEKLNFISGKWKGKGWMMTRAGKEQATIEETAQCKAGCTLYAIEGLGTKLDSATNTIKIIHNAFGIITYRADSKSFVFLAFKDGNIQETPLEILSDKKIRWHLNLPNNAKIRYTADFSNDTWVETGEFSPDGVNWRVTMEMKLNRVN